MPRFFNALAALVVLLLCSCDQATLFESLVPKEESELAKQLVAKVAARDFSAIEEALDPAFRTPDLQDKLDQMARTLPAGSPKSIRTVGSNTTTRSKSTTYDLTLEYEYPASWVLAGVLLERIDDKVMLQGITFTPRTQSLEAENRFTFEGKGLLNYLVLALAIMIPLVVVYALVLCVRTKIARRKWLWVLFIAVGVIQFHFNWTTGAWEVQPVSFMLLGAGFAKTGPVAPWVFTLAVPLGAVLFLVRRASLQRRNDA